jgi:hypothetical protein
MGLRFIDVEHVVHSTYELRYMCYDDSITEQAQGVQDPAALLICSSFD